MKLRYFLFVILLGYGKLFAAQVDTITVFSEKMQKDIKTVIVSPSNASKAKFPTLYLLHGHGGNHASYLKQVKNLERLVDRYQFLVVCPDGGFDSWYWDTESDSKFQYETFVSKELVNHINANYPVYDAPNYRAISGFSMGGHGALYLAIRHQDIFGVVGSTAGGVDIRPFPDNWGMAKRLGKIAENHDKWEKHTVINLLHLIDSKSLKIFIDCGRNDFFYDVNNKLHEKMTYLNIAHHYHLMPGQHNWEYASKSLNYQFAFFEEAFRGVENHE